VQNNQFAALCRAIGRPQLITDARFAGPEMRVVPENARYLLTMLTEVLATRDGAEWEKELSGRGVPCGLVRDIGEVCDQIGEGDRGLLLPTQIPGVAQTRETPRYVNAGFQFEHDGPGATGAAPLLGEHTLEVLRSLGYADAEIQALVTGNYVRPGKSGVDSTQVRE
jgi:crotonobetainyl-CoA:carnitine CoA-transferase CaiB-like acyl-CoA transferase